MRWSALHIPTLRDDPAGADAASHRLLIRAGYIRQLMAGHYSLLPLAIRVRAKIMDIVRAEMAAIGAQEFLLPTMQPAEIWQKSGRWDVMGEEMFRLRDRRGAELALGMTHEEIFTSLAVELHSYRDLPQMWYQFQTKFRDEPRPKSGLIRVREFTMKDSYSFDLDDEGLDHSFELHRAAYQRIFARVGIPAVAVQASSGTMGGSASIEFMCPTAAGEDLVVTCPACGYAANVEKATAALATVDDEAAGAATPELFATPGVRTIDDLARDYGVRADQQIKTLVYVVDGEPCVALLRGDHGLVEQKLIDTLGAATVRPAQPDEIVELLGAAPGSLGAVSSTLAATDSRLLILADEALRGRRQMVTGANRDGFHLRGVDTDRDIEVSRWADLREVTAGEACVRCGGPLDVIQTVEVGHIFKLGAKYTDALGISVLRPDGARVAPIMGCYGIGVERLLAAVVETHHDDAGIVWPVAVAPFEVAIAVLGTDADVLEAATGIHDALAARRVDVVLDDRAERPGVKFRDIELVGIPYRVTVSTRGLAAGAVELTDRATRQTEHVPVGEVADRVTALLSATRAAAV
jgi:prolyl-tRNA synthetase family II